MTTTRVNISVPKKLHKKMQEDNKTNWSAICVKAIKKKIGGEEGQVLKKEEKKLVSFLIKTHRKNMKSLAHLLMNPKDVQKEMDLMQSVENALEQL